MKHEKNFQKRQNKMMIKQAKQEQKRLAKQLQSQARKQAISSNSQIKFQNDS